jgi:hypothetical protein
MATYTEGLNILCHANIGRSSRVADAETTPLREPVLYRYAVNLPEVTGLQLWQICGNDPASRGLAKKKGPALTCKSLFRFGFLWLPDLGSNQGPTD